MECLLEVYLYCMLAVLTLAEISSSVCHALERVVAVSSSTRSESLDKIVRI
jgi:hypothetical protein